MKTSEKIEVNFGCYNLLYRVTLLPKHRAVKVREILELIAPGILGVGTGWTCLVKFTLRLL